MKKLKDIRNKILQKIADNIIEKMKNAKTKQEVEFLFNFGIKLNMWCIYHDIFLN